MHRDESNTFGFDTWLQPPPKRLNQGTPKKEVKKEKKKGILKGKVSGIDDPNEGQEDSADEEETTPEERDQMNLRKKSGLYPYDARGRRLFERRNPDWP